MYIHPLFLRFPSRLGGHEHWVEFPVQFSRPSLVIYFIHSGVYRSIPIFQFHSLPLFPLDHHKFGPYVCESISILQIAYYTLPFGSEVELKEMSLAQPEDSTILSCSFKFHFFLLVLKLHSLGEGGSGVCAYPSYSEPEFSTIFFFLATPQGTEDLSSPDQGWNPRLWQWEQWILTTEPQGISSAAF